MPDLGYDPNIQIRIFLEGVALEAQQSITRSLQLANRLLEAEMTVELAEAQAEATARVGAMQASSEVSHAISQFVQAIAPLYEDFINDIFHHVSGAVNQTIKKEER